MQNRFPKNVHLARYKLQHVDVSVIHWIFFPPTKAVWNSLCAHFSLFSNTPFDTFLMKLLLCYQSFYSW